MENIDERFRDAPNSRIVPRTRSPKRALSPHLGPSPPSAPIRVPGRYPRQPQRISSNGLGSASSVYLSNRSRAAAAPKPDVHTLDDPIMTITSTASVNRPYIQKQTTNNGRERIKKLEDGLKDCLSSPYPRRVVSDTFAARATRAGRVLDIPGREAHDATENTNRAKRVGNTNRGKKDVTQRGSKEVGESERVNETRLSAPTPRREGRGKEDSEDEVMGSGPRRAISLRAESRGQWSVGDGIGIKRLSWLGRRKLVEWGIGVYPRIVYASDSTSGSEDGLGGGLAGTVLCRMGSEHRVWDVVRRGQKFVVRVVGSFMSDAEDVVVYSIAGNGRSRVHSKRTGSGFVGVADRVGRVCDEGAGDVVTVRIGVSGGGREIIDGEIRWRLGGEDASRSGAVLLRFGYYFFLKDATGVRLFTTTHTPEHVRLVARRVADGSIDDNFSSSLTYVVVRVAAD